MMHSQQTQRIHHRPDESPSASLSAHSESFIPQALYQGETPRALAASEMDGNQFLPSTFPSDQFRTSTSFNSRARFNQGRSLSLYNDLGTDPSSTGVPAPPSQGLQPLSSSGQLPEPISMNGRLYDYDPIGSQIMSKSQTLGNGGSSTVNGLYSGSALPQSHHVQVNKSAMQQHVAQQLLQQQQQQQQQSAVQLQTQQLQSVPPNQYLSQLNQHPQTAVLHNGGMQSQAFAGQQYGALPGMGGLSATAGLAGNTNAAITPTAPTVAQEEISTIFVVGFPDDMQEREFQNMFTFSPGFEAATLKIPNKELTAYGPGMTNPANAAATAAALRSAGILPQAPSNLYGGATDPYNLVTVNSGGVILDSRDLPAPTTTASWPGLADDPFIARTFANLQQAGLTGNTAAEQAALAQHLVNPMPPRKQIIGFAKFRTRQEALEARDVLQGRRVDVEKGAVLKAEMAKKNLHTKRGVGPLGLPLPVAGANGVSAAEQMATLSNLPNLNGLTPAPGVPNNAPNPTAAEALTQRERDSAAITAMGLGVVKRPKDERDREREDRDARWKQSNGIAAFDAFHSVPASLPSRPSVSTLTSPPLSSLSASTPSISTSIQSSLSGYLSPTDTERRMNAFPFTPVSVNGNPGTSPNPSTALPSGKPASPPFDHWSGTVQQRMGLEGDEYLQGNEIKTSSQASPVESHSAALPQLSSSSSSTSSIRDHSDTLELSASVKWDLPEQSRSTTLSPPEQHAYPSRIPSHQGSFNNLNAAAHPQFTASITGSLSEGSSSPAEDHTQRSHHDFRLQSDTTTHTHLTPHLQPQMHQDELLRAVAGLAIATSQGMTSPQLPSPGSGASSGKGNAADQNPPINTLYVGNLPSSPPTSPPNTYLEDGLRAVFSRCPGYRKLCFRQKTNGPMCFVEFDDVHFATKALNDLYGHTLNGLVKGGIRLSFSKNPLGVRTPSVSNGPGQTLAHTADHRFSNALSGIQESRFGPGNVRQSLPAGNFAFDAASRGRQDSFDIRQSHASIFDAVPGRARQESAIDLRHTSLSPSNSFGFDAPLGRGRQDPIEARQLNNFSFDTNVIGRARQDSAATDISPFSSTSPPSRFFSPPPSSSATFGSGSKLSSSFSSRSLQSFAMPTSISTSTAFSPFASTPEPQPSRKMSQTPTQSTDLGMASSLGEIRQRSPLPPHPTPPPMASVPEGH